MRVGRRRRRLVVCLQDAASEVVELRVRLVLLLAELFAIRVGPRVRQLVSQLRAALRPLLPLRGELRARRLERLLALEQLTPPLLPPDAA